jgi:hypothetical protein
MDKSAENRPERDEPAPTPKPPPAPDNPPELGGRPGPDPTRYGDWEINGRCVDF